jgi:nucleoside-diphosphate-sugar epimerase
MRVLLTGAAGFIGSHVARLLVSEGCKVYAVVRESSDLWRINDIIPLLRLVRCDLLAFDELDVHLEEIQPDLGIHLAWYVVPGKYLTAHENLSLLNATLRMASRLAALGCRRFVGIGTCFEYDTSLGYLSEESPTKPCNLYAASKLAVQIVLEQLANTTEMKVAWLRLFYQYGPFENKQRLVPSVICSLLHNQIAKVTKGEQIRDFLHVEDVAAAIWAVAQTNVSGPVNIGSGQPIAVRDLVTKIGAILDRSDLIALGALPYSVSAPMFICANNHRLKENTAWLPQYDLEQGLQHTIGWWQRHLEMC